MADITTQTLTRTPVSLPGAGQVATVQLTAGMLVVYQFDTSDATFASEGQNLVLTTANGGTIVFEGFLDLASTDELPVFELLGGEQVPGDVYLFAFDLADEAESETAADSSLSGSGIGVYVDDDGNLYRSLESLQAMDDPNRDGGDDLSADTIRSYMETPSSNPPTINGNLSFEVNEDGLNVTTGEDTPLTIFDTDILALVSDPDPNTVVAVTGLDVSGGTLTQIAAGVWIFMPDPDFFGEVEVTFTVSDGTYTVGGAGTIDVLPVNDAPEAGDGDAAALEDASISGSVADHVTDVDTDAEDLSYTLDDDQDIPVGLTFNPDGSWSFDASSYDYLADGATKTLDVNYTVSDGELNDSGTLTITVTGTNDAPTASVAYIAASEDTTEFSGQLVASDVDQGDTLTFELVGEAPEGFTLNDNGTWTFNPAAGGYEDLAAGQPRTFDLEYTVTDNHGGSTTQSLTVTVIGANDPADITIGVGDSAEGAVTEDATSGILTESGHLTVSDVDDGQAFFDTERVDSPEGALGSLTIEADGTWHYSIDNGLSEVQNLGTEGFFTETFTVWSQDGTKSQDITVRVNGVNDAPELAFTAADTSHNFINGGSFEGIDIDAGGWASGYAPPEWTREGGDRWEVMSGTRHGIPGASDGDNVIDTGVGNGEALSISQQVTGLAAGQYIISLDVFDRGENLGEADSGNVDILWNGELVGSINPGSDAWETGTFTITVGEGEDSGTLTLTGHNPDAYGNVIDNVAMYAVESVTDAAVSIDEDTAAGSLVATAIGSDIDSEGLTFSIQDNDSPFTIDQDGNITLAPGQSLDHEAQDSYTITVGVSDGEITTTKTLTISVNDVNEAPVAPDLTLDAVAEDSGAHIITQAQLLAGAYDPDEGDTANLQVSDVTPADGGGTIVDNHDGTWTFTPDADWNGTMQFEYSVSDGELSTTRVAELEVTSVNDGPTIEFASAIGEDNLIQGGSFEGVPIEATEWAQGYAPPEWTREGGDRWEVMSGTRHGIPGASDGDNVIDTGVGNGEALSISQQVNGLTQGEYVISLDLFDRGDHLNEPDSGNVDVYWNGELVATLNPDDVDWETGTIIVTVGEGETTGTLTLTGHNPDAYGNVIDNITMHRVTQLDGDAVIDENSAPGTYVATAIGSDIDSTDLEFSIQGDSPFTIDDNGVITLAPGYSLDHETTDSYTIKVAVSDGEITTTRDLTINVGDVNETPVNTDVILDGIDEDTNTTITLAQLLAGTDDPEDGELTISDLTVDPSQGSLADGPVDANGDPTWIFTPAPEWSGEVEFSYNVSDGEFTVPQTASMTVTSTNDAPTAEALTIEATEGSDTILNGSFPAEDVDGDALTYGLIGDAPDGFTFDAQTGEWSFDPANDAYNHLADGEPLTIEIQYTVSDGTAEPVTKPLTIEVTGTNDAPTAEALTIEATEGSDTILTGSFPAEDVDGDALTYGLIGDAPDGFTFDAQTGEWSFDPANDAYNHLADGEPLTIEIQYTVSDGTADPVTKPLTIEVTGTNDAPTAEALDITATEGSETILTGSFPAEDVDGDALTYGLIGDAPDGFTFDAQTGEWSFDPANDAYNHLADGEPLTIEIQYTVSDGTAEPVTKPLTIEVTGTNDAPTAEALDITATEGSETILTGSFPAEDVDGDALTYGLIGDAPDGFTFDAQTGAWSFDPANDAYNHLADGEPLTIEIQYTVSDGTAEPVTKPLTIEVTGTNDAPTAEALTIEATEGSDTILNGSFSADDVDGDALTYGLIGDAPDGFTFDAQTGAWSFDPANDAYNHLADGEPLTIEIQYTVSDGTAEPVTKPLTIEVTGTNDAPTAEALDITATEGSETILTGSFPADDVDGDALTYGLIGDVPDGFTFDAQTGAWSFDPANDAYNHLVDGEPLTIEIQYTVSDGTAEPVTKPLTIEVTGTNDAPTAEALDITATEGSETILTGSFPAEDVDGDALTYGLIGDAPDGFTFDAQTGEWSFDPANDAYNHLADGEPLTIEIQYTVSDGTAEPVTKPLTIEVTGTNDAPTAEALDITATEGSETILNGSFPAGDVDGDALTYGLIGDAPDGFTFDAQTGAWSFDPANDAYNHLVDGEPLTIEIQYTVSDGTAEPVTKPLTIEVTGTNDAPTAEALDITATEGSETILTGSFPAEDVDGDALTYGLIGDAPDGFTFDAQTGEWSFDPANDAYNHLADGEPLTIEIQYTVSDGTAEPVTKPLTIEVTGTNDAPTAEALDITATEGSETILNGSFPAGDVDGDALTYGLIGDAPDGFTFDAQTGEWSFDPANDAYNHLADGEPLTIEIQYTVSDGTAEPVTKPLIIEVTGTNDAPTAEALDITATEGSETILNGSFPAGDVDGDALTYGLIGDAPDGFTFDAQTGEWSFDPANDAYNHLADGEPLTIEIQYTVSDGTAEPVTKPLTIEVTGTNDAPTAEALTIEATEGSDTILNGSFPADDVDGDALTYGLIGDAPDGFTFDAQTGAWSFDPANDAYNHLADGEPLTIEIQYTVSDGTADPVTKPLTIEVTGTNDAPTAEALTIEATEGSDTILNGSFPAGDVDGDALTYGLIGDAPDGFTFDAQTGAWSFDPTNDAYNHLADGEPLTIEIQYTVSDGTADPVTKPLTIEVTGTNDAPTAEVAYIAASEDTTEFSGQLVASDVDQGDTLTFELVGEAPEGFTLNNNGIWTFNPAAGGYEDLAAGQPRTFDLEYTVTDNHGGSTTQSLTVTVIGANDPADITIGVGDSAEGAVTEDATSGILTESGHLTVSDVDDGQAFFDTERVDSPEGALGSLTIEADGTWHYSIDNGLSEVQNLGTEGFFTETFTVWSQDGTKSQDITVRVNGVNDAPELAFTAADTSHNFINGGSFEGIDIDAGGWASGYAPPEWTREGGDRWEVMSGTRHGIPGASDGDNVIDTGVGNGEALSISQQVTGLAAGQYIISLDVFDRGENLGEADSGNVDILWNGELVGSINPGSDAWETGTFTITVGEGEDSGTLTLTGHNPDAYGNVIDNVAMYAVESVTDATVSIDEDTAAGSLVATAIGSDIDSEGLTFSIQDNDSPFTIDQDGNITLAPGQSLDHEAQDSYTITVGVSDGEITTTKTLTISVNDVNEAPVAPDLTLDAVAEDSGAHIITQAQLLAGAYDPDEGDTANLQVSDVTPADGGGTIVDNHDGTWTFTPDADWNGTMQFEYSVSDGELSTTRVAELEVTSVNDGPTIEFASAIGEDNLIQGGSFEGVPIEATEWAQGYAPPEWTREGGDRWEVMSGTRHGIPGASDGDNVIDTGVGNGEALSISQQVNGLTQGEYVISLDLFDRGDHLNEPDSGNVDVYWNGELVATLNPDDVDWETGTIIVTVGEGETTGTLTLTGHNPDAYGNVIDNITMHRVTQLDGDAVIDENSAPGTYVATAIGSDIDSTDLEFSIQGDSPFTIDDNGVITLAPGYSLDHETTDSYTIKVAVSDGEITTTRDLTINVGDVNETPVNTDVILDGIDEDTNTTITLAQLLAGTDDPEDGELTISDLTVDPSQGSLADGPVDANGDPTWIFTPAPEWSGEVEFSYNVSDGEFTVPQTASMTVTSTNDAPTAEALTIEATEGSDTILNGSFPAEDVDGDALTYGLIGDAPDGFTFDAQTGEWSFDPANDAYNHLADGEPLTIEIQYTVSDGTAEPVTKPLTIEVTGTNDAPTAEALTIEATEGSETILNGSFPAGDVDGDALTYGLIGDAPDGFTFDAQTGAWSFDPANDAYNHLADGEPQTIEIQYTVSDGTAEPVTKPLTIEVTGTNDAPTAEALDITATEGSETILTGSFPAEDVDGDALTYGLIGDAPDGFTFDAQTGAWSFDPANDAYNHLADGEPQTIEIQYTVSDGTADPVTKPLTIEVTGTNDAPTAEALTIEATEGSDTILTGSFPADDVDGDSLTYGLIGDAPDGFTFDAQTGEWSFDPANDAYNHLADGEPLTIEIQYTVSDGTAEPVTKPLTIEVTGTNDAPTAEALTIEATEGSDTILTGSFPAEDVDGDALTYGLIGDAPDGFTFDAQTGEWSFDPANDAYNHLADGEPLTIEIQYTVSDGTADPVTKPLTIEVTGTNDAPTAEALTIEATEGSDTILNGSFPADDVDGDSLTYGLIGDAPDGFTFDAQTGEWSFDPANDAYNHLADGEPQTIEIQYTVSDGTADPVTKPLTIEVTGTNDAPTAEALTIEATEGSDTILNGSFPADDVDGDSLTYGLIGDAPDGFTFDAQTGEWSFDPANGAYNHLADGEPLTIEIQYTVSDGTAEPVTKPLTIEVTGTNDAPTAEALTIEATEGSDTILTGSFPAEDVDGDALTYGLIGDAPDGFTFDAQTGEWSFDPANDAYNHLADGEPLTIEIQYTVSDGTAEPVTKPLTIEVTGTNDGPVATADTLGTITVTPGETISVDTPDANMNVTAVASEWAEAGVTVRGLTGDGLDADTWQDASLSTKDVSFNENGTHYDYSGFGVRSSGNIDGGEVDTVDGDDATSELVGLTFATPMQSVTITLSALFDGVDDPNQPGYDRGPYDGGFIETARLAAFDAAGDLIGYVDRSGTPNGLVTVTLDAASLGSSLPIAKVAVMPLDDGANNSGSNSDFLVQSVTGETVESISATYLEDTPIDIDPALLLGNDSDPDASDVLSVISVGDAEHGTVTLGADGHIHFTPEADFSGQATFTYTVSDGHEGTSQATVTLNIAPVNDAPTIDLNAQGGGYDINAADSDSWGYNALGVYVLDENGDPVATNILYGYSDANGPNGDTEVSHDVGDLLAHLEPGQTPHFFILNSGDVRSGTPIDEDSEVTFTRDADGNWHGTATDIHGNTVTLDAYFDATENAYLNPDGLNRFSIEVGPDHTTYSVEEYTGHAVDWDDVRFTVTPTPDADDDFGTTFNLDGDPVSIVGDISISDVDSAMMSKAVITLTNTQAGDHLNTEGISGSLFVDIDTDANGNLVVTLTGDAQASDYESAIKAITFSTDGDEDVAREISVQVTDAGGNDAQGSNVATTTIGVEAAPDPDMYDDNVTGQSVYLDGKNASYHNMLGVYTVIDGKPSDPEIILTDSRTTNSGTVLKTFAEDEEVRFFLIPNGGSKNFDLSKPLYFVMDDGQWALSIGKGEDSTLVDVRFDDPLFNPTGEETTFDLDGLAPGFIVDEGEHRIWVDDQLPGEGSNDNDFNDMNIRIKSEDPGIFNGKGGDDVAYGQGGNDTLNGGGGDDHLYGGEQNDVLSGGTGDDYLEGNNGQDTLSGGAGDDTLYGGEAEDLLVGGDGDDYLDGGNNQDTLDGGDGNDQLYGGRQDDILIGGDGDDYLDGGADKDTLDGGSGHDQLHGGGDADVLGGGDGNDLLYGDGGHDTLGGGEGDDFLDGGSGKDLLVGGGGNDILIGGDGHDILIGGSGNDLIMASTGHDEVILGDGNDTIFIDRSVLADGEGEMVVSDFNLGQDVLELGDGLSIHDIEINSKGNTQLLLGDEGSNHQYTLVLEGITEDNFLHGVTPAEFADIAHVETSDSTTDSLIQMLVDADNKSDF